MRPIRNDEQLKMRYTMTALHAIDIGIEAKVMFECWAADELVMQGELTSWVIQRRVVNSSENLKEPSVFDKQIKFPVCISW